MDRDTQTIGMASVQKNPMLIDTVLGQLFGCTDYETLKSCRLVCHKWKDLCDRRFFKKTAFVLKHYPVTSKDESFGPITVEDDTLESAIDMRSIFESVNEEILFSATFKFQVDLLTPNIEDFYLEPNKTLMTSLELNLTQWSRNYYHNLDNLIGPSLRRLKVIDFVFWELTTISLDKLVSISEAIELENCNIIKNSVQKISSKVLELKMFNILLNDKIVSNPEMRDIIDFGPLKKLYLKGDDYDGFSERSHQIVNLSDCQNIKSLILLSVTVILDAKISPLELKLGDNKYTRNGKDVDEFKLRDYFCSPHFDILAVLEERHASIIVDFSGDTTVRKLEISLGILDTIPNAGEFVPGGPQVDLSLLPKTIESLCFNDELGNIGIPFIGPIILPNLKHLRLDEFYRFLAPSQFKGCPLLQDISLLKSSTVITDHLPPTVKRLSLSLQDLKELKGSKQLKLDVFVLFFFSAAISKLLTSKLKTQLYKKLKADLFVFRNEMEGRDLDEDTVVRILKTRKRLKLRKVAFGPVGEISDDVQQKFSLPFVFQRNNYYIVEGKAGTKITKKEFRNLVEWG